MATLAILLVLLEIAARIYLGNFASRQQVRKYCTLEQLNERYAPEVIAHRYLGYCTTPSFKRGPNKHNSLGFRGEEIVQPKPPGEFRIVCLGGSTTYTTRVVDHRRSYPALLETELIERGHTNVTVVNAGVPGYSSWETLINLQLRVLDLSPDLLIVYHGVNDIHPRLVWPPSAYRGDNSGRSIPFDAFRKPSISDYSTVARILSIRTGSLESLKVLANKIDPYPETSYALEFVVQKRSQTYPNGKFREVSARDMLHANLPIYFKRNIANIVAIAADNDILVVLATFAYSTGFPNEPQVSSDEYGEAYREMEECLREIAAESDSADLFEFASVFPQDTQYFYDGRHLIIKGVRLKAELFADYLSTSGRLPAD